MPVRLRCRSVRPGGPAVRGEIAPILRCVRRFASSGDVAPCNVAGAHTRIVRRPPERTTGCNHGRNRGGPYGTGRASGGGRAARTDHPVRRVHRRARGGRGRALRRAPAPRAAEDAASERAGCAIWGDRSVRAVRRGSSVGQACARSACRQAWWEPSPRVKMASQAGHDDTTAHGTAGIFAKLPIFHGLVSSERTLQIIPPP